MSIIKNKDANAIKIFESIDGLKHVVMESARLDACIAFAREHKADICGATVSRYHGFTDESLEFLKDMPWLTTLMVCDDYQDVSAIGALTKLEYLQLSSTSHVDFTNLVNLREYTGLWPQNNDSFYLLKNIHSLGLRKGSKKNCITQLSAFPKLVGLEVIDAPFNSLDGIEKIPSLESLGVHFCRKITSIKPVASLKKLTRVHFESCKKITSFSPLANNTLLEKVNLEHCGDIDDINFVSALPALKMLSFFGTVVSNNDLSPILKCKSLESLGFNDKKTYSHKCSELKQALGIAQ